MQKDSLNKQELTTGISLALVYVFRMLGLFMVIPVIAIVATEFPDYSPLLVGIAIGGYGLTQAILQIPFGLLSDRWGRKPVIYMGLILFTVGSLIAASADSMLVITIGRIMQGAGAIAGAVMALATDVTRESQRPKVMAIIGVSIGFSFYIALLVGPLLASSVGIQGIFLVTALLALCCFPLVHFGVAKPTSSARNTDNLPVVSQLPALFRQRHLWRLNSLVLGLHLLITMFFIHVPLLLSDLGFALDQHYELYLPVLIASVIGLVALMRVQKKLTISNLFGISAMCMAIGFVIMTQQPSYFYLMIAGICFFTGFNFLEAKMPAMVSSIAPAGQKGSAMGIYASFQFFGAFLGGGISGLITSIASAEVALYSALAIVFLMSIVARGLANVEKVKRLSVSYIDHDIESTEVVNLIGEIQALDGVKDVHADTDSKIIYLKVDSNKFNLQQVIESLAQTAKNTHSDSLGS